MNPYSIRAPLITLVALWVGFVWATADQLPERIATHFGTRGEADGWMSRTGHVQFLLGFAIGLPLFFHMAFAIIRASGGRGCNLPHRAYWLSPERKEETLFYLQRHGAWLACITVSFFLGIHLLILRANAHQPPALPGSLLAALLVGFLVLMTAWVARLLFRFSRVPKST